MTRRVQIMDYMVVDGRRVLPESSWKPVFQRSLDAFHEGKLEEGTAACEALLNAIGLPTSVRERTYQNQFWYARPLADIVPGASWALIAVEDSGGHTAVEPSPAVAGDRTILILRATLPAAATAIQQSGSLAAACGLEDVVMLPATVAGHTANAFRPFWHDGSWHVATILGNLDGSGHLFGGMLPLWDWDASQLRLFGPRPGNFGAGWSPVDTADGPRFVAWWEPTEVIGFDEQTSSFSPSALQMAPHIAERFQGGSQGVSVPGGYLFLVNEATTLGNGVPVSFSRFVRLDPNFKIREMTRQFFLEGRGRDFASGLARHGDRLIAGFTSGGTTPVLATMGVEQVLGALLPVAAPGPPHESGNRCSAGSAHAGAGSS